MSWSGYIPGDLIPDMVRRAVPVDNTNRDGSRKEPDFVPSEFVPVPPRGNLLWAAVDLDGTLAEGIWTPDNPTSNIGPVKVYPSGKTAKDLCLELVAAGYKIVVHTARGYTDLENIERWLEHHGIPYRQVVCGKLLAAVYIDDRNKDIFDESWVPERKT